MSVAKDEIKWILKQYYGIIIPEENIVYYRRKVFDGRGWYVENKKTNKRIKLSFGNESFKSSFMDKFICLDYDKFLAEQLEIHYMFKEYVLDNNMTYYTVAINKKSEKVYLFDNKYSVQELLKTYPDEEFGICRMPVIKHQFENKPINELEDRVILLYDNKTFEVIGLFEDKSVCETILRFTKSNVKLRELELDKINRIIDPEKGLYEKFKILIWDENIGRYKFTDEEDFYFVLKPKKRKCRFRRIKAIY